MIPVAMGFHPSDSIVVLPEARADEGTLIYRFDLAGESDDLAHLVASIDRDFVLVAYSTDPDAAAHAMRDALAVAHRDRLCAVLLADGHAWRTWSGDTWSPTASPYDIAQEPFTLRAHFDGRIVHPSREAVLAQVELDEAASLAVLAATPGAYDQLTSGLLSGPAWVSSHRRWLHETTDKWIRGEACEAGDVALFAASLEFTDFTAGAYDLIFTRSSDRLLQAWARAARTAPNSLCAPLLSLTAATALMCGNSAMARAALDRALEVCPGSLEATCLSSAFTEPLDPEAGPRLVRAMWDEFAGTLLNTGDDPTPT